MWGSPAGRKLPGVGQQRIAAHGDPTMVRQAPETGIFVVFPSHWLRHPDTIRTMNHSTGDEPPIRKLASDDDRGRIVEELSAALGRGQLDFTEFDERSTTAWACRYRDELTPLIADVHDQPESLLGLPQPDRPGPAAGAPVPFARSSPATQDGSATGGLTARKAVDLVRHRITGEKGGSGVSFAIMGGVTRTGSWLVPNSHTSIVVMGGNEIDLREARFESGEIRIYAFAVMGGIDIIVPEGVRVIDDGIGIMGGFDTTVEEGVTVRPGSLPADAPAVRIGGIALMGGVSAIIRPQDQ